MHRSHKRFFLKLHRCTTLINITRPVTHIYVEAYSSMPSLHTCHYLNRLHFQTIKSNLKTVIYTGIFTNFGNRYFTHWSECKIDKRRPMESSSIRHSEVISENRSIPDRVSKHWNGNFLYIYLKPQYPGSSCPTTVLSISSTLYIYLIWKI